MVIAPATSQTVQSGQAAISRPSRPSRPSRQVFPAIFLDRNGQQEPGRCGKEEHCAWGNPRRRWDF